MYLLQDFAATMFMSFYFSTYLPTELKFTIFISTRLEHCEMATKMLCYVLSTKIM